MEDFIRVSDLPNFENIDRSKMAVWSRELLQDLRKERGLSQDALAKGMGIAVGNIKKWEDKEKPTEPKQLQLGKLGRFFGVVFYAPWPK